jgi:hypothetical protein
MADRHDHPHTHEHYSMGQLASHLRSWHLNEDAPDLIDEHPHFTKIKAHENDAARIDVHPWSMNRFKDAEVVFAAMEGCLKADAILTAILKHDLNAAVYSFPSVTLGNCPELAKFSRLYLEGKTVIAVLDADWADPSKEGAVENQGRIYQGKLLALGIEKVHLSAPPQDPKDEMGHPIFKGVDDFLGIGKGGLHELVCIDVEPPKGVVDWIQMWDLQEGRRIREQGHPYTRMRSDGIQKIASIITSMAVFAGGSGMISVTLSCMANAMGVSHQRVSEVIQSLVGMGAIEVDGELDTGPSFFGGGDDWVKRPTITITEPALRATELPHRTTGDVLGPAFFGGRV